MTTRTFVFCGKCNPRAHRRISAEPANEQNTPRQPAWFEGHARQAAKLGWVSTDDGRNLCLRCAKKQ